MSSILEALRELEGSRSPIGQSTEAPAEAPATLNRAAETFGIVAIGLVIGAVGFFLLVWVVGLVQARAARDGASTVDVGQASGGAERPAWLVGADPPRARVEPEAAETAAKVAAPASPLPPAREAAAAAAPPGRVEVTSIQYSQTAAHRSVALRLDGGDVVTLREHESARGVEVQLIQPDGVYVRRGGDVFVLAPSLRGRSDGGAPLHGAGCSSDTSAIRSRDRCRATDRGAAVGPLRAEGRGAAAPGLGGSRRGARVR